MRILLGCGTIFCLGVFGPLAVPPLFYLFGVDPKDNPLALALMLAPVILFLGAMILAATVGRPGDHVGAGSQDIYGGGG